MTAILRFGYNQGIPEEVDSAWGCRAIHERGGASSSRFDYVADRQSLTGPQGKEISEYLNKKEILTKIQPKARLFLNDGEERTLYKDTHIVVRGNDNKSFGYVYLCAFLFGEPRYKVVKGDIQVILPAPGSLGPGKITDPSGTPLWMRVIFKVDNLCTADDIPTIFGAVESIIPNQGGRVFTTEVYKDVDLLFSEHFRVFKAKTSKGQAYLSKAVEQMEIEEAPDVEAES